MLLQHRVVARAAGVGIGRLGLPVFAGLCSSALFIAAAWTNAMLFNELLGQRRAEQLAWLVAVLGIVLVSCPVADLLGEIAQNRSGLIIKRNLRRALLNKYEELGPMRSGTGQSGALHSVMTDGVEAIEPYAVKYLTQLVVTVIVAAAITMMIGMNSPLIAGILLVCGIAVVAIPRLWDRILAEKGQEHWAAYEDMNSDFIDAMLGMTTLKSFGAAEHYGRQLESRSTRLLDSTLGQLRLSLGETGISGAMKVLGPAVALVVGIVQIGGEPDSWVAVCGDPPVDRAVPSLQRALQCLP
jgi:ABC transporter